MDMTATWMLSDSYLRRCIVAFAVLSLSRSVSVCSASTSTPGRLLVVSFDGFRNDFFNRSLSTPNFHRLTSSESVLYRRRIENVFPTQTFPNHFSIATGRYAEEHGVLASEVMDVDSGSVLTYGPRLFHYDPKILPIWTLNEQNQRRSGCMMWPACDVPYGGINATFSLSWNASMAWEERLSLALSWFKGPARPANLVMMYLESPDMEEHVYGPNSPQTNRQIERADKLVGKLVASLAKNKLLDVNVVLLSDHGMESVTLPRIINLTDILSKRGRAVGTSPVLQIYPEKGKMDELYSKLKALSQANHHFDAYLKKDIPDHFRYKNCRRSPPILAVARPQYAFHDLYHWIDGCRVRYNLTLTNQTEFGVHGYDPKFPSMQPFVIAFGPKFKSQSQLPERIVDLYGMFADILGLQEPFKRSAAAQLSHVPVESIYEPTIKLVFFSLASVVGLTTLYVVFVIFQRRHSARNLGYTLVDKDETGV